MRNKIALLLAVLMLASALLCGCGEEKTLEPWTMPAVDAKPTEARAAKYCAVKLEASPSAAMSSSSAKRDRIYFVSPPAIPTSIIFATISGTVRSNNASSILKSGARMLSALYFFRYVKRYFKFYLSFHGSIIQLNILSCK